MTIDNIKNLDYLKIEFEAEGASKTDLTFLAKKAAMINVGLAVKIGGCEAKTDYKYCQLLEIDSVIAPMVESDFAAQKLLDMSKHWKPKRLGINIETDMSVKNFKSIVSVIKNRDIEIVFGRSDYASSIGLKNDVNNNQVIESIEYVAKICKTNDLKLTVGGGMNYLGFEKLYNNKIIREVMTHVETRKLVFKADENLKNEDFLNAILFEIDLLKKDASSSKEGLEETNTRIKNLEDRI